MFIYSEKATQFCEISTIDLTYVVHVKSMVEISQKFVALSEYINVKFIYVFTTKFNGTDVGGFQLLDLIITELKSHMTCYNSIYNFYLRVPNIHLTTLRIE